MTVTSQNFTPQVVAAAQLGQIEAIGASLYDLQRMFTFVKALEQVVDKHRNVATVETIAQWEQQIKGMKERLKVAEDIVETWQTEINAGVQM